MQSSELQIRARVQGSGVRHLGEVATRPVLFLRGVDEVESESRKAKLDIESEMPCSNTSRQALFCRGLAYFWYRTQTPLFIQFYFVLNVRHGVQRHRSDDLRY